MKKRANRQTVFRLFTSPGTRFLRVPYADIERLGLARFISPDSHQKGTWVYLAVDDAQRFISSWEQAGNPTIRLDEYASSRSYVRSYPVYKYIPYELPIELRQKASFKWSPITMRWFDRDL